jgi:hypothetical protein
MLAAPAFATSAHRSSGTAHSRSTHKSASARATSAHGHAAVVSRASHRLHGQQSIDPDRATQIQQALIREHYLTGEASGKWDDATVAAMQKYQADQGWQTKLMPDSRALKKLGLGPDYSNALNAQSSNFGDPVPARTIPSDQVAGFTAASGIHQ